MPSSPLLSSLPAHRDATTQDLEFEADYSELEPEERAERTRALTKRAQLSWPEDRKSQEALATERLSVAQQNATLFRARRLSHKGHGLEEPERFFRTGIETIDELLAGGLQRNELVEVVGWRSSGRFSMTLSVLAGATQMGESAALVDLGDHLDPQAAMGAGIDLERLLWLRPQHIKEALGATELLLGAGFSLIVLDLGQPPLRGGRGIESAWLRLQRGAIDHHCALLVSSPYRASGTAAHAVLELHGARGGWFGRASEPRLLGGLLCEARLSKSRLARTRTSTKPMMVSEQRTGAMVSRHLFELEFAGGLAEPTAQLPKLFPHKRREQEAPSNLQGSAALQSSQTMQKTTGALRHAG